MGEGKGRKPEQELVWDLVDRCLFPLVFSHAAAVILSTLLNALYISQISSFALFLLFLALALGSTIFYHNLKVTLPGKCVLITGCESKIGNAAAKHLDELGLTVFASFESLGEASDKLKGECSGRVHTLELNVTSEQSILAAFNYVVTHLPEGTPGIWAVINTTSWAAFGEVEWVPFSVYQQSTDINLLGTIRVTQTFLPLVRKVKGRIINVTSIVGRIPSGVRSPFCAVKAGVEAFSECLRLEMRRWGVDVIVIEPGFTTTGTWFDNKEMIQQARDMWTTMKEQVKEDCGQDYFEHKIRSMKEYNSDNEDVSCILRSVGDAIVKTFPLGRYTPVTKQEKLQALVAHHLPRSVYDIIYYQ